MAYTSFRQTDSRTVTSYVIDGNNIVASDNNYCLEKLKVGRKPKLVDDCRIEVEGHNGANPYRYDATEQILNDLKEYSHYDFTNEPKLAFLGKKNNHG